MRLSFRVVLGAILASLAALGCTAPESGPQRVGDVGVSGVDATIAFEDPATLTLAPGETAEVAVVGEPAAPYGISFLLVGDALDASLDATSVVADAAGRATVRLRAPNRATYFALRATIKDGPSANLNVAVSDEGFGDLLVLPEYTGERGAREWVASVVAGTTCEALADAFPSVPEGPVPVTAKPGDPLIIEDVPVGPNLAVFVRGGHYMWGCADEPGLIANQTVEVTVKIVDKPLDLSQAELQVELGYALEPNDWAALTAVERQRMLDAYSGGQSDAVMLLKAMRDAWGGTLDEFDDASAAYNWPSTLDAHFSSIDLGSELAGLIDDGLAAEPPMIHAALSAASDEDHAVLTLLALGTATPAIMEVPAEYVVNFTADPDDTARVGGSLFWMPSRYFGHVAAQQGLATHPSAMSFAAVLGEIAQCSTLDLQGTSCTADCMVQLCQDALATRWTLALSASTASLVWGELPFEASGASRFDDEALITGFTGRWLGDIQAGLLSAKISGEVEAYGEGDEPE